MYDLPLCAPYTDVMIWLTYHKWLGLCFLSAAALAVLWTTVSSKASFLNPGERASTSETMFTLRDCGIKWEERVSMPDREREHKKDTHQNVGGRSQWHTADLWNRRVAGKDSHLMRRNEQNLSEQIDS